MFSPDGTLISASASPHCGVIEAAKRDKNGVLLSARVNGLALRLDVSVARKSKPANQKHRTMFGDILCSRPQDCDASKCWRGEFGLATDLTDVSTKLHEASYRLHEASWRHCEVVLRTGFGHTRCKAKVEKEKENSEQMKLNRPER